MNRFVLSAMALAAVGGSASASSHGTEEWLSLDRQIETLASTLAPPQDGGVEVSAWIKTQYDYSDVPALEPAPGEDLSGFGFAGIRVNVKGKVGEVPIKISIDGAKGTLVLKDAFATLPLGENVKLKMGQFKGRFLFTGYDSDEKLVLYRRSLLGEAWRQRDAGAELGVTLGPLLLFLSAHNGGDAAADDLAVTAKAIWAIVGKAIEKQSGGFGVDAETAVTVGLGWLEETSVDDGSNLSAEAMATLGRLWLQAEVVDHGDDMGTVSEGIARSASSFAGFTPYTGTVEFMFTDQWSAAVRHAEYDDTSSSAVTIFGVNWYRNGHANKWQLNYGVTDSDDPSLDGDLITLGWVVNV